MAKPSLYCTIFLAMITFFITCAHLINSEPVEYYSSTANLSTSWNNSPSIIINSSEAFGLALTPILLRGSAGSPQFVCGFYCPYDKIACLFGVLIFQDTFRFQNKSTSTQIDAPKLVWSANRDRPVKINATLQLTQDGDLVLADADGTLVWSTNTGGGKSISGLNLTELGNLVLFNRNNTMVWQSFNHPTDTSLPRQMLVPGQKLTSSISALNRSQGMYSFVVRSTRGFRNCLFAYIESNPPQFYFESTFSLLGGPPRGILRKGNFVVVKNPNPPASAAQFMKLDPDGHLKFYRFLGGSNWIELADLLTLDIGDCGYPMVCGRYGVCSNRQCGCPEEASFFRQINYRQPSLRCSLITPISCNYSQYHSLLELNNTSYFYMNSHYLDDPDLVQGMELEDCKKACLKNCSCKAAVFSHLLGDPSKGLCLFLSEVFSLINNEGDYYNVSVFLKVQQSPNTNISSQPFSPQKKSRHLIIVLASSLGALFGVFFIVASCFLIFGKKRRSNAIEEFYLDQLSGMPTRFSYDDLKAMTSNFSCKLGEGGFGLVFEGSTSNGTKVAVKLLDGLGQIKSFLAEVETIGSIHHVNLVRLIGFCAENSNRLLVYEYMSNGSLDKWVFHRKPELALGWQVRRKIILDIAKGLAYLHEDCRQKIYHLDIKPQNILLDENFSAKLSDFGLSKLIDKDQSQVVTVMKGTPGYMAPEWLSSFITERVDVYSFGVVVLEILCGRRNLDRSQPEEDMHLLSRFKEKAEEEGFLDMVDKYSEDMQLHGEEVVEMMKVAAWCLQSDYRRRPSMTVVVQVLEGLVNVQDNLDYNFTTAPARRRMAATSFDVDAVNDATPLLPSVLSGPR